MIYISLLFISALFVCTLLSHFFAAKQLTVSRLSKVMDASVLLGLVFCIGSYTIYYVGIGSLDSHDLTAAAADAFYVYSTPMAVFAIITLVLTLAIHFLSGKLQAVRIAVSHLASLLILLYTLICASWSHYEEIDLALCVNLLGMGLSLVCLASPALQMKKLAKMLSDSQFVKQRLAKRGKKQTYAMERKRIKDTKKRIKKGTKR